jgi:hypothetical protein
MGYTVRYRDAEIDCPTAGDVAALFRELPDAGRQTTNGSAPRVSSGGGEGRLTVSRYHEFVGYLDKRKKELLRLLVDNPHGKTDDSIRKALDIEDNKELGGIMSGISKLAKRAGLSLEDVLTSQKVKIGNESMREYKASATFRSMATEIGGLK